MLPKRIAFVDLETTGGSIINDRVIEVGIVVVEDNKVVATFNSLVNPQRNLPPEIEILTGIRAADLENAPSFYEIKKELKDILEGAVFAAHNVRFDYSFLKQEFERFDIGFSPKHFCTVKLSRSLFPQFPRHNLDSVIERFNIKVKSRHRAMDDAMAIFEFYLKVQTMFKEEVLIEALNKAMRRPSIPINLSQEILDELPEAPGVYIFYGDSEIPLYIGKSISIRKRVLQHFSADQHSSTEMKISQQVKRVEYVKTAGELGALLKESEMIKKMQPLYNRKLRQVHKLTVLFEEDKGGYKSVTFGTGEDIRFDNYDKVLGIFRSKKQAKELLLNLVRDQQLCEKILGLETGKGSCFGYKLGRCKGGCLEKEKALLYNFRFDNAFIRSKIRRWPFEYPVIIEETDHKSEYEAFIIDKWCFLGTVRESEHNLRDTDQINFDLDTYKIILGYLKKPQALKQLKPFTQNAQF